MKNEELKQLKEFVSLSTKHLVGVLMKRLEILAEENKGLTVNQYQNILKSEIKERIYENGRELEVVFNAFDKGVKFTIAPRTK